MTGSRQQAVSCNRQQAQTIVSSPCDIAGSRQQVYSLLYCSRQQAQTIASFLIDMTGNRQQVPSCSRHQAKTIGFSPLDMTGSRQQVASCSKHQAQTVAQLVKALTTGVNWDLPTLPSFWGKMSLSLSNSLRFALIPLVKIRKNSKNSYFCILEV